MPGFELGVDYGTSNTVAMLRWPDGRVRQLLVDGASMLPSAVYAEAGRGLLVGREAERNARLDPARFEPNPKRRIDDGDLLLGEESFAVVDVIAATLARVLEQATRAGNGPPTKITMTYPASWQQTRQAILVDAAARAGMDPVALVPEPVAAGRYFATGVQPVPPGKCLVVYDLGAGTFDATLLRATADGFDVLAVDGLDDFGGLDLDALVVDEVAAALADQPDWRRLALPATTQDRRHRRALWEDACAARESLSQRSSAGLYVPLFDRDFYLSREEFERTAEPQLRRTVERTVRLIETRRVPAAEIAAVLLVGGASRTPLIATLLHRRLGIAPTVMEQPELLVAEGALYDAPYDPASASASASASVPVAAEPDAASDAVAEHTAEPEIVAAPDPEVPNPEAPHPAGTEPATLEPATLEPASLETASPEPVLGDPAAPDPGAPTPVKPPAWRTGIATLGSRKRLLITAGILAVVVATVAGLAIWWPDPDQPITGTGSNTRTSPTPDTDQLPSSPPTPSRASCSDINLRRCDPDLLTIREIAPRSEFDLSTGERSYSLLHSSLSSDCSEAARNTLVTLLKDADCNQSLRVLLRSGDDDYYTILGVFNLSDSDAAKSIKDRYATPGLRDVVRLNDDPPIAVIRDAPGWIEYNYLGHFFYYCITLRTASSTALATADPRIERIAEAGTAYIREILDDRE